MAKASKYTQHHNYHAFFVLFLNKKMCPDKKVGSPLKHGFITNKRDRFHIFINKQTKNL